MDRQMNSNSGVNTSNASDTGTSSGSCSHCGQPLRGANNGLEQFLGRMGVSDDMIDNLKTQFQNVDVDQYLNTAREYLQDGSSKAKDYARENPGKVAAGVAALAVGAGLLISALNRE